MWNSFFSKWKYASRKGVEFSSDLNNSFSSNTVILPCVSWYCLLLLCARPRLQDRGVGMTIMAGTGAEASESHLVVIFETGAKIQLFLGVKGVLFKIASDLIDELYYIVKCLGLLWQMGGICLFRYMCWCSLCPNLECFIQWLYVLSMIC